MIVKRLLVVLLATCSVCAATNTNTNIKEINSRHQQKHEDCNCKCNEQPAAPESPPPTL